ncbi:hypothetical protein J1605_006820 [Eschrichtius robustus]|uniref:Uncharacterized protein n=1 Tax=Eschrichtius robustus TaxID=9764 RepID=A0AB34H4P5_ESCRO|nr:hypothetical protein J1605_006820 [Eschrichtius robustus]
MLLVSDDEFPREPTPSLKSLRRQRNCWWPLSVSPGGQLIPVKNLSENIEILLPRLSERHSEPTVLNLTRPEALWVNLASGGVALGIQLHCRPDIPLGLSLGYG